MKFVFEESSYIISRIIFSLILLCCVVVVNSAKAQEAGPLLMKQELGYTLAGGVAGVGIGALLWFMDPLNPHAKPIDHAKDGFVYGSFFGALFGFYLLNNAVVFPNQNVPVQNFDDLLGFENHRSTKKQTQKFGKSWTLPLIHFRF